MEFLFAKPEVIRSLDTEAVADFLAHVISLAMKKKQTSEDEEFPPEMMTTLTQAQIEALKKRLPNLFKGYEFYKESFRIRYSEKLRNFKRLNRLSFE